MDWIKDNFQLVFFLVLILLALGRVLIQAILQPGRPQRPPEPGRPPPIRELLDEIRREAQGGLPQGEQPGGPPAERPPPRQPVEDPALLDEAREPPGGAVRRAPEEPPILRPAPVQRAGPPGGAMGPRRPAGGPPRRRPAMGRPQAGRPARPVTVPTAARPPAQPRPKALREPRPLGDEIAQRRDLTSVDPEAHLKLDQEQLGSLQGRRLRDIATVATGGAGVARLGGLGLDLRTAILAQVILGPPRALEGKRRGVSWALRTRGRPDPAPPQTRAAGGAASGEA